MVVLLKKWIMLYLIITGLILGALIIIGTVVAFISWDIDVYEKILSIFTWFRFRVYVVMMSLLCLFGASIE